MIELSGLGTDLAPLVPWVFGLLIIAFLVGGFLLDRKRRERLQKQCLARGWTYAAEDPLLVDRWSGQPFGQGNRRRAQNVITGTAARPFTAFDYSYETYTTDSDGRRTTHTHRYAVVVVPMPAPLPAVEVAPEGMLSRFAGAVGLMTDIELESDDFNRAFTVRATDRKLASDILPPRTMEHLLSAPRVAWRIEGDQIVRWHNGRLDPDEIIPGVAVLDRVVDGIPSFVWNDYGPGAGFRSGSSLT